MTRYLDVADGLAIHERMLEDFGGASDTDDAYDAIVGALTRGGDRRAMLEDWLRAHSVPLTG